MALSKVFIHLVFQGSSEDECLSVEGSHNRVVNMANQPPSPAPTQGSPALGNRDQLSRERGGKETAIHEGDNEGVDCTNVMLNRLYPHAY